MFSFSELNCIDTCSVSQMLFNIIATERSGAEHTIFDTRWFPQSLLDPVFRASCKIVLMFYALWLGNLVFMTISHINDASNVHNAGPNRLLGLVLLTQFN